MTHAPKTIQIFLPTGKPRGLKLAQVTSRISIAIYVPRADLLEACSRSELQRADIYFLFGDEDDAKTPVYVGESENCLDRLKQHNSNKEFWNAGIVIVSKTNELTKCQIRYLEWFCCDEIQRIGRGLLLNKAFSQKPFVSESILADLMEIYETITLLLSTLDYPIFDQLKHPSKGKLMYCKSSSISAVGEKIPDGFVVFRNSKAKLEHAPSTNQSLIAIRNLLKNSGTIKEEGEHLIFTSDHIFPSPSQAAEVVLGRSANGWAERKDSEGTTLDQILRQGV